MKPRDPVWNFFTVADQDNKTSAKCNDCKTVVSAKAPRLRVHREKCPMNRPTQKRPLPEEDTAAEPSTQTPEQAMPMPAAKKPRLLQSSMNSYSLSTDQSMSRQLDEQIAKLFFACNLPFNIADHPVWKETIQMLRPGYQPPNRKDIGGHLLDQVHEKITNKVSAELKGKDVVLIQDGWSDIHNTPVIATSLQCDNNTYFMSAIDTGTNKKTAAYCTAVSQDSIKEAAEKFHCKVTGVVTDNEKKMVAMKQNLVETDPELTVYGCSAHWLNLLGQDVTPPQVINQVVEVNKYFRNHHVPGALLAEIPESVKPQLPAETRWNSQLTCIDTYIRNRPYLLMICAKNEEIIDSRIRNLIHNVGLFNEVKNLQKQLQPISSALDRLQSDSSTIADACEIWLHLLQHQDLQTYHAKVKSRFNQAMTPSHYLANLLHPGYRGKKLQAEHVTSAQDLLLSTKPAVVPDLLSFMTDSLPLPKTLVCDSVISNTNPTTWWRSISRSSAVNDDLCQVAVKLLRMPSSSASIERVFSNFGLIQTKLRNRLGLQKAARLVFCYRYLRGKAEIDW